MTNQASTNSQKSSAVDCAPNPDVSRQQSEDTKTYVRFVCANRYYALDLLSVREVAALNPLSRVPHAPKCCLGLMNHAGRAYTIIDLAALLNSKSQKHGEQVLMLDDPSRSLGIAVDYVEGIGSLQIEKDSAKLDERIYSLLVFRKLIDDIDSAFKAVSVLS